MKRSANTPLRNTAERRALRRQVKQFYLRFNKEAWKDCFSLIDPQLTKQGRVELAAYAERMRAFKKVYCSVKPWHTRLSLHLDASANKQDKRPFAYVYVIWQDEAHGFHMFRERWIKDDGWWFTRVVGLVPNRREVGAGQE